MHLPKPATDVFGRALGNCVLQNFLQHAKFVFSLVRRASMPPPNGQPAKTLKPAASSATDETEEINAFKGRLSDEYKILQDKIDKIGAFRFTIKGWAITAVVGASAAGTASASLLTVLTISLGLVVLLSVFFYLEFEQVRLSRLFGNRARRLESAFRQLDRGAIAKPLARIPVPYTASEIALASHRQRSTTLTHSRRIDKPSRNSRWVEFWRVARQSHIFLYLILAILVLVPLALRAITLTVAAKKTQTSSDTRLAPRKSPASPIESRN